MSTYEMVRLAIVRKQIITAYYDGYYREMCPHVIGTKNGREQGLFYQFGGQSKSGLKPEGSEANWRCIPISGLTNVKALDGPWHTASNHSRQQSCVDQIDVEVSF
jgi:hypothetical protein